LQPTALVHEAYLRLTDKSDITWESRRHFFFAAARAMRDILVEQARRKVRPVRGGGRRRQELDEACAVIEPPAENVLAVHEALDELEKQDPVKAQIVLLRYFSGLTTAETAAAKTPLYFARPGMRHRCAVGICPVAGVPDHARLLVVLPPNR
jgi:RNA polymerase sigma factor (TIGR02999 family)